MTNKNRIVLAYSGGLDTSVAIPYLKDQTGKDVVAVSLDVGQGGERLETIKERALACGAVESYIVDARDEFANEYCMPALQANAMYEGVYPLVSAISTAVDHQASGSCSPPVRCGYHRAWLHREGQRSGPFRGVDYVHRPHAQGNQPHP
jgi:hypothetical protein